jgi:hypothetical protein
MDEREPLRDAKNIGSPSLCRPGIHENPLLLAASGSLIITEKPNEPKAVGFVGKTVIESPAPPVLLARIKFRSPLPFTSFS